MGVATYTTTIKKSGTSTSMTGEATTLISGTTYGIDDAIKDLFDRDQTFVVKDGGTPIATTDYTIDYLRGRVTLDSAPGGAVTIDGYYLPLATLAGANTYDLTVTPAILDTTDIADSGWMTNKQGLIDVAFSASRFDDLTTDYRDHLVDGDTVVIEIISGGGAEIIRGWFNVSGVAGAGDLEGLEEQNLSFELNGDSETSFSWV